MPGTDDNQDDDDGVGNRLVAAVKSGWSRFWARVWRGWWSQK